MVECNLKSKFISKINFGASLLQALDNKDSIAGITKLKRKIKREISFLNKVLTSGLMKNEHLQSTNLHHFDSLVTSILKSSNVVSVLETVSYKAEDGSLKKLCIDIVCENGNKWVKVIARNPKALSQICAGAGEYGQKSVTDHSREYIECSKQNLCMFQQPKVCFIFMCGISKTLANCLTVLNVEVVGEEIDDLFHEEIIGNLEDFSNGESGNNSANQQKIQNQEVGKCIDQENSLIKECDGVNCINLDVSTMIAYVSSLTNGNCNASFNDPLLRQQALWERERPVKPILDNIFDGKHLICCKTACESFEEIVNILGGPSEKQRAEILMSRLTVVPDKPYNGLNLIGKIKPRSLIIFGTGYHHRAITVTANEGFVRAAKHQGANFAVIVHESRALTESKELKIAL